MPPSNCYPFGIAASGAAHHLDVEAGTRVQQDGHNATMKQLTRAKPAQNSQQGLCEAALSMNVSRATENSQLARYC